MSAGSWCASGMRLRRRPKPAVPDLPGAVGAGRLAAPAAFDPDGWDDALSGEAWRWGDYAPGEKIDHVDGMTIEEAEHATATRLYQNTAKVHFNQHTEGRGRFGRRLVYGGHVMSVARALSFNGLANGFRIAAINGGRHVGPVFAGDTIYAWSEVVERLELPGNAALGALRLRTVAAKDDALRRLPGQGRRRPLPGKRRARSGLHRPDPAIAALEERLTAAARRRTPRRREARPYRGACIDAIILDKLHASKA